MKINILYQFRDGPWGGGNQFLKGLKKKFVERGVYEESPTSADVILFNSYPFANEYLFNKLFKLKKGGKIVIQRVDGPIYFVRGKDIQIDNIIYYFNKYFADGTIFQSEWSRKKSFDMGMRKNKFEAIIMNAPDEDTFPPKTTGKLNASKFKLIATSWSSNIKKGFNIYKLLDKNLDFNKYQMTFVGNSPIKFNNINYIPPLDSKGISSILKDHDIYITASIDDPCSNSLIEALHCGLPVVVLQSGGHPEIIGKSGEIFNGKDDVLNAIDKVASNIENYRKDIIVPDIEQIADLYYEFCKKVYIKNKTNKKTSKFLYFRYLKIMKKVYYWKFTNILKRKLQKWGIPFKKNV